MKVPTFSLVVFVLAGLTLFSFPVAANEGGDPQELDELARNQPANRRVMTVALNSWLQAAGAALGRGDWASATSHSERAWMLYEIAKENVSEDVYTRQAAYVKMAAAKAALKSERDQYAAGLYREAARIHPDPQAWISAGQIATKMEDFHQARRDFEEALRLEGVKPDTHLRLAGALYQLGETERAIAEVETGIQAGASEDQAERLLKRFQREVAVEGDFAQGGTLHFMVAFENVEEQQDFLRKVEGSLERVYEPVCRFLNTFPKNRVPVVIYPSTGEYREASGAPGWTAAVYNGKIRVPTGDLAEASDDHLDRILAHEFAHYLIERLAGRGAPAWLQEGLAQHVEADGEPPKWLPAYAQRLIRSYRDKPLPFSLKQLEGTFHGQSGGGVQAAYCASYYAVGHIISSGGMFRVQNFMEALKGGLSVEDALYRELYLDYRGLDEKWVAHAKSGLGL